MPSASKSQGGKPSISDARRSDCEKIRQAVLDASDSQSSTPPSKFLESSHTVISTAFRNVLPTLEDPELVKTIETIIDLDRQANALKDGGHSEARGEINLRYSGALEAYMKACPTQQLPRV